MGLARSIKKIQERQLEKERKVKEAERVVKKEAVKNPKPKKVVSKKTADKK